MSSFVVVSPDAVASAATQLTNVGSTLRAANAAAAGATTSVAVAAQDEVSAAIARLFGAYGQEYQALNARVALFHADLIQTLQSGAASYAAAEAASAGPLQLLLDLINAPTNSLLGRPLIGDGTNGAPGTGQAGGAGGLLWGNGGNGGSGAAGKAGGPAVRLASSVMAGLAGPAESVMPRMLAVRVGAVVPADSSAVSAARVGSAA